MTLKQRLEAALNQLSPPAAGASVAFDWDLGGIRLLGDLRAMDALALAVGQLTLVAPQLDQASLDQLDQLTTALARQISYLLEPIMALERDAEGCAIQMRSNPPQRDDDGTAYYELLAKRGRLSLVRFRKTAGAPREVISAHLTREVFVRLVGDLASAVAAVRA